MNRNSIKLSMRLALGFSSILVILIVMIGLSLYSMTQINTVIKAVVQDTSQMEFAFKMQQSFQTISEAIRSTFLFNDQELKSQEMARIEKARADYEDAFAALQKENLDEKERALFANIEATVNICKPLNDQVLALGTANKTVEALDLISTKQASAIQDVFTVAAEFIKYEETTNKENAAKAAEEFLRSFGLLITLGLLAIAVGIVVSYYITRSITKPVNKIVDALNEGAQQVAAASNQLSSSAQQLSQGSSEQASAIEETSSTLQESSSMLQQNTANTKQAAGLSEQAKESADKGSHEMQEMMSSIQEIKKSSDQIAKIIKVIDDIAFQTNILALNAAIEAARAGEAGMGFAVVAEEVRNLAQRSAQAAKDTTTIIEANIELSGKGVAVAERVREALSEITVQAKKVSELMEEIAAASQEQAQGVDQVNKAMTQMESVTQQNAANAEESASAAEELTAQADSMRKIVRELSQLVNSKIDSLQAEEKYASQSHHLNHSSGPAKPIRMDAAPQNTFLTDKADKKTKIISPEDVIPLEKDPHHF